MVKTLVQLEIDEEVPKPYCVYSKEAGDCLYEYFSQLIDVGVELVDD